MKNIIEKVKNFFKSRGKNPQFYIRIVLISFLPILTAMGLEPEAFTSWASLWAAVLSFVSNPFLLGLYIVTLVQSFSSSKNKIEDVKMEDK